MRKYFQMLLCFVCFNELPLLLRCFHVIVVLDVASNNSCCTFVQGWIWSVCSLDNLLATGSWDRYIKFWDLAAGGEVLRKFK